MTHNLFLRRMPDGMRCRTYFLGPRKTVCPALLPPCVRTTTSACSVSTSMILPLPSSPHWAPTKIVVAITVLPYPNHKPTGKRNIWHGACLLVLHDGCEILNELGCGTVNGHRHCGKHGMLCE